MPWSEPEPLMYDFQGVVKLSKPQRECARLVLVVKAQQARIQPDRNDGAPRGRERSGPKGPAWVDLRRAPGPPIPLDAF